MTIPTKSIADSIAPGVTTFYSYKGGTGRTMALANVACLLARKLVNRERILVIDWDLEAPGLHYYLSKMETRAGEMSHPGVVDYFSFVQQTIEASSGSLTATSLQAEDVLAMIDVEDFVQETRVPNVFLMCAGRFDADYQTRVAKLNWLEIYAKIPTMFESFAKTLCDSFQTVLIDSRTGMTDTSSICTTLLPDKLVVVFTPNSQSLHGVEKLVSSSLSYRRNSRDVRPLLVYPLASRIDAEREELRNLWRFGKNDGTIRGFQPLFESVLSVEYAVKECDLTKYFDEVQIQHTPDYAYGENLAALDRSDGDRFSIVRSYDALAAWLSTSALPWENPERARQRAALEVMLSEEARAINTGKLDALIPLQERIVALLIAELPGQVATVTALERYVESLVAIQTDLREARRYIKEIIAHLSGLPMPARVAAIERLLLLARMISASPSYAVSPRFDEMIRGALRAVVQLADPPSLASLEHISSRLRERGAVAESLELSQRIVSRLVGDDLHDWDQDWIMKAIGRSKESLALGFLQIGNAADAREIATEVVELRTELLGTEDDETLRATTILARASASVGDYAAAMELLESVAAIAERTRGAESHESVEATRELARFLHSRGDTMRSRVLLERLNETLDAREAQSSIDAVNVKSELGAMYYALHEFSLAKNVQVRALVSLRRIAGGTGDQVMRIEAELALTLFSLGEVAEAASVQSSVLGFHVRESGAESSEAIRAKETLGRMSASLHERKLREDVLLLRQESLGPDHSDTLSSRSSLAATLAEQGDVRRALQMQQEVVETRQAQTENDHTSRQNLLEAKTVLARLAFRNGEFSRARVLQEQLLSELSRDESATSAKSFGITKDLADTLCALGQFDSAEDILNQFYDRIALKRGVFDSETIAAKRAALAPLVAQGKLETVREEQAIELLRIRSALGPSDRETIAAMRDLLDTVKVLGDSEAAADLLRKISTASKAYDISRMGNNDAA